MDEPPDAEASDGTEAVGHAHGHNFHVLFEAHSTYAMIRGLRNRRSGSGADLDVDFRVLCEAPARGSEAPEGEGLIEDEAIEVLVLRHRHTEKGRTTVAVRLAGERG